MNALAKSPLAVTDPRIRISFQLAGLRFMWTRTSWFRSEVMKLELGLKSGKMTSDEGFLTQSSRIWAHLILYTPN